ncbi:hypothetical protein HMPREF9419_0528 [Prevotella nigrescens ATCC 33563]|nr:hypothetical protein HMPREF9419_0528 [Prevotella nigrescens ATCC 33563]
MLLFYKNILAVEFRRFAKIDISVYLSKTLSLKLLLLFLAIIITVQTCGKISETRK